MIRIKVEGIKGFSQTAIKLADLKARIPEEIKQICNNFGNKVVATSRKDYLNGPRPEKLGVRTNQLRNSIRFEIEQNFPHTSVTIGTDVPYAAIHEKGGLLKRGKKGKSFKMKARPFLKPAVKDNLDYLKDNFRTILNRIYSKGKSE